MLVQRRLLPTSELPVHVAALAHKMVRMQTTFKMFKRLVLYVQRFGQPMRVPAYFGWPSEEFLTK